MVRTISVDHLVLVVSDVEATVAWYHDRLGMEVLRLEEWRNKEVPFVSLRVSATALIDVMQGERSGVNVDHLALFIEDEDLADLAASGDFDVVAGPAELFGARGMGLGLYVRDPEGNVVELRTYPAETG